MAVGEEAGTVTVTAVLDIAVSGGFTVDASTADGTTNGATAGSDYTMVSGETLTFSRDGGGDADGRGDDQQRHHH